MQKKFSLTATVREFQKTGIHVNDFTRPLFILILVQLLITATHEIYPYHLFRANEFSWNGIWKLENDFRDDSKGGHLTTWTIEHLNSEVQNNSC